MFADEESELVCVLNDGWHACCSAPVVVQMALLVREQLHLIWWKLAGVIDDVVACRCDGSLTNRLADEEEVVSKNEKFRSLQSIVEELGHLPLWQSNRCVNNCSSIWILRIATSMHEDASIDALADNDEAELRHDSISALRVDLVQQLSYVDELLSAHVLDVAVADSITVDEDLSWQALVFGLECAKSVRHVCVHVCRQFDAVLMFADRAVVLHSFFQIHRSWKDKKRKLMSLRKGFFISPMKAP